VTNYIIEMSIYDQTWSFLIIDDFGLVCHHRMIAHMEQGLQDVNSFKLFFSNIFG
jgi:hypothetical protein